METPNFWRTSSMVVSRCRLSSTTFNLNSAVYCLRFFSMGSNTFHFSPFPCSSVHYTRYWTQYPPIQQRTYNNKGLVIGLFIMGFFLKLFGFLTLVIGIGFVFLFMGAVVDVIAFILLCLLERTFRSLIDSFSENW